MQNKNEGTKNGYYFEMNDKEIHAFIEKQKSISLNDSVDKVKEVLGQPTLDDKLIGKKGEFVARELAYYLRIWEKGLVNEKRDMVVYFFFDKNNLLKEVTSNFDGVENRKRKDVNQ